MNKQKMDLSKCAECQKPFSPGQEYWSLIYQEKAIMNACLTYWDKYTTEKKELKKLNNCFCW